MRAALRQRNEAMLMPGGFLVSSIQGSTLFRSTYWSFPTWNSSCRSRVPRYLPLRVPTLLWPKSRGVMCFSNGLCRGRTRTGRGFRTSLDPTSTPPPRVKPLHTRESRSGDHDRDAVLPSGGFYSVITAINPDGRESAMRVAGRFIRSGRAYRTRARLSATVPSRNHRRHSQS